MGPAACIEKRDQNGLTSVPFTQFLQLRPRDGVSSELVKMLSKNLQQSEGAKYRTARDHQHIASNANHRAGPRRRLVCKMSQHQAQRGTASQAQGAVPKRLMETAVIS